MSTRENRAQSRITVEVLASHTPGADGLQRPLLWCSRVQQRLMLGVEMIGIATAWVNRRSWWRT
jgi:hypothetical protein